MTRGAKKEYRENYKGEKVSLPRFVKRVWRGMPREQAISQPIGTNRGGSRKGKYVGKFQQVWEEIKQDVHPTLTKTIVSNRLWKGWNYKQAISLPKGTYRDRY